MSAVFVDTSALYALLSATDPEHARAAKTFAGLAQERVPLATSSYVLVEVYALLSRRLGLKAVKAFRHDFAPVLRTSWVDAEVHEQALDLLEQEARRKLSLVDATSFVLMRRLGIDRAFAFDEDFKRAGFEMVG